MNVSYAQLVMEHTHYVDRTRTTDKTPMYDFGRINPNTKYIAVNPGSTSLANVILACETVTASDALTLFTSTYKVTLSAVETAMFVAAYKEHPWTADMLLPTFEPTDSDVVMAVKRASSTTKGFSATITHEIHSDKGKLKGVRVVVSDGKENRTYTVRTSTGKVTPRAFTFFGLFKSLYADKDCGVLAHMGAMRAMSARKKDKKYHKYDYVLYRLADGSARVANAR